MSLGDILCIPFLSSTQPLLEIQNYSPTENMGPYKMLGHTEFQYDALPRCRYKALHYTRVMLALEGGPGCECWGDMVPCVHVTTARKALSADSGKQWLLTSCHMSMSGCT